MKRILVLMCAVRATVGDHDAVAQGLDNATIGARLHISERTARNHVSAILAKLGINTRAQAIVRAREAGFGREKLG